MIQEEIDALEEEKELLEEQRAEAEEFYNKLIEDTTAAFDAILEQLENQKSKWEELAEIQTIANAYKEAKDVMDMLGISMEDVLNDAPGAFEKFKDGYIQALLGAEGENENFVEGINYALGQAETGFQKVSDKATSTGKDIATSLNDGTKAIETFGSTPDTSSGQVSNLASSAKTLTDNTRDTAKQVGDISTSLSTIDGSQLDPLKEAINGVVTLINGDEGSLLSAINGLDEQIEIEPVIEKFTTLQEAVNGVVTALGGGEGGESNAPLSPNNGPGGSNPTGGSSGEGGGTGLTGAIEAVKQSADTNIGTEVAEEGGEGDGTVIGDFGALTTSINNASTAIGTSESTEESADLIGSITALGIKDTEVLTGGGQGEGIIGDWESFNKQLSEAEEHISGMVEGLENLQDSYETTLTVTLEIEGGGEYTGTAKVNGGHARYSFNVLESIGLPGEGGTWESLLKGGKAKFTGTANMNGNWGFEGGKTLISELGPELVVYPNGTFETFDRPQVVDLPRGSIIFNHLQTDEILNPNNQIIRKGKSNLNGTVSNLIPYSLSNPEQYAQFMQLADALKSNTEDMRVDLSDIDDMTRDIQRSITNSTYNSMNQNANITFGNLNFTCTGITSADVLSEVGNALEKEFSGIALNAYKKAMAH